MDGVILTPLNIIHGPKGDVMHVMKSIDKGYYGFGEAYFSTVKHSEIKGWKKHREMTLNLIVPHGEIEFVVYDENEYLNVRLSPESYQRLTVMPGLWVAFRGIGSHGNILLNIADILHAPDEVTTKNLSELPYEW